MNRLILAAALALSACAAPGGSEPHGAGDAAVAGLAGEYRVASVDGQDIDLPHAITARITHDRIEVESDCIRFAWSYRRDAQGIATLSQPAASCRRALLPQEQAVSEAFAAATTVTRTPANGLAFGGGGRSIVLFSQ